MAAYRRSSQAVLLFVAAIGASSAATVRVASAPSHAQAVTPNAERAAHMQVHFSQVMTVHEAVIRGDLAAVREPATWLAGHDPTSSLPAGSAPFVAEMRRAAGRTAQAPTIQEAALGTADMLKTCGDCHRGVGTMPAPAQTKGPDVGGLVGHMLAHQRSTDQMLQGLVVPSNASWRDGAAGLRGAPLRAAALPDDPQLTKDIIASERRIHELAEEAAKTEDRAARAVFYGQIIARCADCHTLHGKVWGPARR